MSDVALLYNQSKRNFRLREKIETEMFINRSKSQEAAYDYITKPKKFTKTGGCSYIAPFAFFTLIYILFLTFK
jgi:hypothetical protein